MKNPRNHKSNPSGFLKPAILGMMGGAALLLATHTASAQTTNAFDVATDPAYAGTGAGGSGLLPGGQNGGSGFGPWTFTVNGNGGAFTQTYGPSGASWDLWNTAANGSTIAVRPFASALVPGESFSVQLRLNSLDNSGTTNAMILQDAGGNTIFAYWHTGYEPNGAVNGQYTDAITTDGAAVGFSYNYQQFSTFTFTLNSATTYTFTDNTTGHSFTGTISGSIAKVAFFRGSKNATGGGQDYQIDVLKIVASAPPSFVAQSPAPDSFSGTRTNISLQVVAGGTPINTGTIAMKVDGTTVTPSVATALGITTINYAPTSPLSAGTPHTVQVSLADNNNSLFTNTWSFTTGFPTLPAILPGPIVVSNSDLTIFTASGDAWLGTNYGTSSSKTVYARYSMAFDNLNGETGGGGGYGGLHFFSGTSQHLIVGNSWLSLNWSLDTLVSGEMDLNPVIPIVFGEWHTIVERIDYSAGLNANITIWLDFDFSQPEASQPNSPLIISMDNSFDSIHLRTGNGTASATFTNIMIGALGTDVGILPAAPPTFQGFVPGNGAPSAPLNTPIGVQIVAGSIGIRTSDITMTLDGNPVVPQYSTSGPTITVSYQPSAFAANSSHTVTINLTDTNGTPYSMSWSFTVDAYPSLPVTIAGPVDVSGGGLGVLLFSNLNGWLSGNYESSSTNTLWTRFSMVFFDLNGETADDQGGCYGGLHFYQDTNERLLTGETWLRNTWSVDDKTGGEGGEISLLSPTIVVANEWHTLVVKSVYSSNAPTAETIYLDPDFAKTPGNQTPMPLTLSMDNTFNAIRLRCGNGSAAAEFTNIVVAATATDVGFAAPVPPGVLSITLVGGNVQVAWTSVGTLQAAPTVTGPWTDTGSSANPQTLPPTDSAQFYRLRQ